MWTAWRNGKNTVGQSVFRTYFLLILMASKFYSGIGGDRLSRGEFISGNQTIVSQNGTFELGFFTKGKSRAYLGIWYRNFPEKTIVWVANRDAPLLNTRISSSRLQVSQDGNLALLDGSEAIWSPALMSADMNSTEAVNSIETVLLDSGNLVVRDSSMPSTIFWQSFDKPTDTWLPGAALGYRGLRPRSFLTSWKNSEDPSRGKFSVIVDSDEATQFYLEWKWSTDYVDSGESMKYWSSEGLLSPVPEMALLSPLPAMSPLSSPTPSISEIPSVVEMSYSSFQHIIFSKYETYYTYSLDNDAILSRLVIDASGQLKQFTSLHSNLKWNATSVQPRRRSEVYASCGEFSILDSHSDSCSCLQGFTPYSTRNTTKLNDWSGGCVRKIPLQCQNSTLVNGERDRFAKIPNVKLPSNAMVFPARNAKECELICLENCRCVAYAYHEGGCSVWNGILLNVVRADDDTKAEDLYLKLAGSELPDFPGQNWVVITAVLVPLALLVSSGYLRYHCMRNIKHQGSKYMSEDLLSYDFEYSSKTTDNDTKNVNDLEKGKRNDFDLPLFSYESVSAATNNFSAENKLGQGGYGPVYKGKSLRGHKVAVKRLSKRSGQGLQEFRNEIKLIAKLQHRNLVRLLGCCIEQDENILIYEYMANRSMDFFLFDPNRQVILEWRTRVRITEGIAHGLLYLHVHSRLRIIHRDLKASNILLDGEMNAKISDFGMARIFGGTDAQANTKRIVGTYGYMAPEYALDGIFSVKSDVFSFGVLVLEIVSGKKNTGFYNTDSLNLLGHAWELWTSGRAIELVDPILGSPPTSAVLRYINVGLLCVQGHPNDRPTMSNIISMLTNELTPLPKPKQPAFSISRSLINHQPSSSNEKFSANGITISTIGPR